MRQSRMLPSVMYVARCMSVTKVTDDPQPSHHTSVTYVAPHTSVPVRIDYDWVCPDMLGHVSLRVTHEIIF